MVRIEIVHFNVQLHAAAPLKYFMAKLFVKVIQARGAPQILTKRAGMRPTLYAPKNYCTHLPFLVTSLLSPIPCLSTCRVPFWSHTIEKKRRFGQLGGFCLQVRHWRTPRKSNE